MFCHRSFRIECCPYVTNHQQRLTREAGRAFINSIFEKARERGKPRFFKGDKKKKNTGTRQNTAQQCAAAMCHLAAPTSTFSLFSFLCVFFSPQPRS